MLLALDTSGPVCSAAVAEVDEIVAERCENIGRGHAERLMPMLQELMVEADIQWSDIKKIACTTGPGSFTGLRVGLATARGLALALGCPCKGVSVFDAFSFGEKRPLAVTIDARRDQIWMQIFEEIGKSSEPFVVSSDEAIEQLPNKIVNLIGTAAPQIAAQNGRFSVSSDAPSPPVAGLIGAALTGKFEGEKPKPLYLRAPDAKRQEPPAGFSLHKQAQK